MSVALTNIGSITTPTTRTETPVKKWFTLYGTLANAGLSPTDLKAIGIWAMLYSLNAGGGTDYRTNIAQLIQDAETFTDGVGFVDLIGQTAAEWNVGNRDDGALSTDLATLLLKAQQLRRLPAKTLDMIRVYLRNKPGS